MKFNSEVPGFPKIKKEEVSPDQDTLLAVKTKIDIYLTGQGIDQTGPLTKEFENMVLDFLKQENVSTPELFFGLLYKDMQR